MTKVRAALILLAVAFVAVGGSYLYDTYRAPQIIVSASDEQKHASDGADPTPKAGTRIFRALPLKRTREVVKAYTAADPVKMIVGAVGFDGVASLHLVFQSEAKCKIVSVAGVAYGFDAWGAPGQLNKHGENHVAFRADKLDVEAGHKGRLESPLHFTETASLVVAHFDEYVCADGSKWTRP